MKRLHIAVDLDGVLLEYHGVLRGPYDFGAPLPEMVEWVCQMLDRGHRITVFTSRTNFKLVQKKLMQIGFPKLPVTNIKRPDFSIILDDRALTFYPDFPWSLTQVIEAFEPWWKR